MAREEQAQPSTRYAADPLAFERLISDLSSRFINLEPGDVDAAIEDAQRRVCEELNVDLSVLWQNTEPSGRMILTHFFSRDQWDAAPQRGMSGEQFFPWCYQEIQAGRSIATRSPDELPPAAEIDRQSQRAFGVRSQLTIPLRVGSRPPVGALGFGTTRAERDWPEALVSRLHLVAQVFANALARRRSDEALRDSETRLALAADSAEAGLCVLEYATNVMWVTERARAIFGLEPDEIVTPERMRSCIHPDDRERVRAAFDPSAPASTLRQIDHRVLRPDGETRWVSSQGRHHFAAGGARDKLMGVTIDVTERRRAQEALQASQTRLDAGAEIAGLGFYEAHFAEGRMYVDARLRELCGMPADPLDGLEPRAFWLGHIHPEDVAHIVDLRRQHEERRFENITVEYRYLHPTLGERWFQHISHAAARDADGRLLVTDGVIRDITEERQIKQDLRDLSRRLIGAQEEERSLLARELHDDISQRLAVLAIDVGRAEQAAESDAEVQAMRTVREGLVRLSEDVHSLAYQLHPSILEELGLAEALRAECERRRRQTQLDLSVEIGSLPEGLSNDAALCLFRVAQEALNNIAHHAHATSAGVRLSRREDGALLTVTDDGAGFDVHRRGTSARLGIASMRERVRLVNGTLDIESAPDAGTTVTAWVPAQRETGEAE